MNIGWVTPTLGCFGAVREMCETSNVWVRSGCAVTVFHRGGGPCTWLSYLGRAADLAALQKADLDVLIGLTDWQADMHAALASARARLKAICIVGFEPTPALAATLRGETEPADAETARWWHSLKDCVPLPDSSWQAEWMQEQLGITSLPPFGGVNVAQFHRVRPPKRAKLPYRVLATGDPRERKGSDVVQAAVQIMRKKGQDIVLDTYWGKRIPQKALAAWYSNGDLFLDAERRAGWCNPVVEAMACGTAVVCTDIPAVRDVAVHGETALLVSVDDAEAMARQALWVLRDRTLRQKLIHKAFKRIQGFSYDITARRVLSGIEERLRADSAVAH